MRTMAWQAARALCIYMQFKKSKSTGGFYGYDYGFFASSGNDRRERHRRHGYLGCAAEAFFSDSATQLRIGGPLDCLLSERPVHAPRHCRRQARQVGGRNRLDSALSDRDPLCRSAACHRGAGLGAQPFAGPCIAGRPRHRGGAVPGVASGIGFRHSRIISWLSCRAPRRSARGCSRS
jgi:hypothetical protein